MWAWYREWSQILRLELEDGRLLRGIGLTAPRRRSKWATLALGSGRHEEGIDQKAATGTAR